MKLPKGISQAIEIKYNTDTETINLFSLKVLVLLEKEKQISIQQIERLLPSEWHIHTLENLAQRNLIYINIVKKSGIILGLSSKGKKILKNASRDIKLMATYL